MKASLSRVKVEASAKQSPGRKVVKATLSKPGL